MRESVDDAFHNAHAAASEVKLMDLKKRSQESPIRHLSLMVRTPDFQSGNAEFESRRCHQKMLR